MFYFFYNLFSIFLLIPVLLYHYYRSVSRGRKSAFAERFGIVPSELRIKSAGKKVIWVHAVSVGEAIASRTLLKSLCVAYADHLIFVSTTTETGRNVAEKFSEATAVFYFPFDFLPAVNSALNAIKPAMVIIMETEIWPNFNCETARRNIPLFLVNGRISDRSFNRYQKFSWFFRHTLNNFSRLCMQTATDRERIIAIGAPPEKTFVAGNLKYDINVSAPTVDEKKRLRQIYAIPEDIIVMVAASTHAGEETQIISCYKRLLMENAPLVLVLVPRHPERATEVMQLLNLASVPAVRRTELSVKRQLKAGDTLLVDTIGEMMSLYALADVAFVGGSLVPTGGHNLLEASALAIPSVFGPHTTNFREITQLVLHYGAGIQVENEEMLYETLLNLVFHPELRGVLGKNGLKLMRDTGGATERHLALIAEAL